MIPVEEALALVLQHAQPLPDENVELEHACGRVLTEIVSSDVDSPPHDKSLVDGYAIRAADLAVIPAELDVLEEVTAGKVPTREVTCGASTRIMTGAPIPAGADAIVMLEDSEVFPSSDAREKVRLRPARVQVGQNIMRQGTSLRRGELILQPGHQLRAIEVGLLAELGAMRVSVHKQPSVAILSTGDELVPHRELPAAGQIRNSNGPMLEALAARAGANTFNLGIGQDRREELSAFVQRGLQHDVLLISGGVSAGVLDLVPEVLTSLGVRQVFHRVCLKPGKPLWFGVLDVTSGHRLVVGLPGNPVSGLVCFELFVRPAIKRLAGRTSEDHRRQTAILSREFQQRGVRPVYQPARLQRSESEWYVEPLDWKGSADLRTLADADCLAHFPAGERRYPMGDAVEVLRLSD